MIAIIATLIGLLLLDENAFLAGAIVGEPVLPLAVAVAVRADRRVERGVAAEPPFDIVYCTLLLHHFSDADAIRILAAMKRLARHAVLVDDLQRTRFGWLLAVAGCHLLSRSPVVHFDGPQSVRAAFTCAEARGLAAAAGWGVAKLRRHWPERYLLSWEAGQ